MQYLSALKPTGKISGSRNLYIEIISSLFILLFVYTGISKLITIDGFSFVIGVSKVFDKYFRVVAWTVPIVELVVAALLFSNKTRLWGLRASLVLMILFDLYISYVVLYMPNKPCQCGGVISKMSWEQHLVFNAFFTALAVIGIILEKRRRKAIASTKV